MDLTTRDAVDELLQTYSETGGINYLDAAATLPSRHGDRGGLRRFNELDVNANWPLKFTISLRKKVGRLAGRRLTNLASSRGCYLHD